MKPAHSLRLSILLAFLAAGSLFGEKKPAEFDSWLPITESEKQLAAPTVEKDAGVEVLFSRIHIADEPASDLTNSLQRTYYYYVRLKVFDERGKQTAATIDLPYGTKSEIKDVAGRTVKPDGTILELDKKSIYKRDLVRAGGIRQQVISFAMPGVEPGTIVEYRWRLTQEDNQIMYVRLQFQGPFPIAKATFFVKPLRSAYGMSIMAFHCQPTPLQKERDGSQSLTIENIPAAHVEPFTPSAPNVSPWALLYYRLGNREDPDSYWREVGENQYLQLKNLLAPSDDLKLAATQATHGASSDEEKVAALISYVRKNLRGLDDPTITPAERQKFAHDLPKNRLRTPAEVLQSGIATAFDMDLVFMALADQAGLDARPALVADRTEMAFNPKAMVDRYFLKRLDMAVRLGNSWKFYDVTRKWRPADILPWQEEGVYALIGDPEKPFFVQTPVSPPERSVETRSAKLRLSSDGALEGDVEESFSGHAAEIYRGRLSGDSDEQSKEWLRTRVSQMFPDAEVTDMAIENIANAMRPLRDHYHLRVAKYAQATGKRIFFQPIAFRKAQSSPFTAGERQYPVEFQYAWKEIDQIAIQLPSGWSLDHADQPGSMSLGRTGSYKLQMSVGPNNELFTTRELTLGDNGVLIFKPEAYGTVKKAFDEIEGRDRHTLSLKENQP